MIDPSMMCRMDCSGDCRQRGFSVLFSPLRLFKSCLMWCSSIALRVESCVKLRLVKHTDCFAYVFTVQIDRMLPFTLFSLIAKTQTQPALPIRATWYREVDGFLSSQWGKKPSVQNDKMCWMFFWYFSLAEVNLLQALPPVLEMTSHLEARVLTSQLSSTLWYFE